MKRPEFEVEISRPGESGAFRYAAMSMPATWAEFNDALEKARLTSNNILYGRYSFELLNAKRKCLSPHIPDNINIYELNLLALRLSWLDRDQSARFGGMVRIEELQRKNKPVPMHRLINLTFSLGRCPVAYGVHDDEALGKFLYENDMLSDEDHEAAAVKKNIGMYSDEFFAKLGRKHRTQEKGVFIDIGYLESGGIDKVYVPGEMAYFQRSGAPVVLNISKGYYFNPGYDRSLTAALDLPVNEYKLRAVLEQVKVTSLEECGYTCADCLIPAAKEWIDNEKDIEDVYYEGWLRKPTIITSAADSFVAECAA